MENKENTNFIPYENGWYVEQAHRHVFNHCLAGGGSKGGFKIWTPTSLVRQCGKHALLKCYNEDERSVRDEVRSLVNAKKHTGGLFPEVFAYSENGGQKILMGLCDGTQLKHLGEVSRESRTKLKNALIMAVAKMGGCHIADRGCQNIMIKVTNGEYEAKMIDGDQSWDKMLGLKPNSLSAHDLFHANMAYMAEHLCLFSKNNRSLFEEEVRTARYFNEIQNKTLQDFFFATGMGRGFDNLAKAGQLMKNIRMCLHRLRMRVYTTSSLKYKALWNLILDQCFIT